MRRPAAAPVTSGLDRTVRGVDIDDRGADTAPWARGVDGDADAFAVAYAANVDRVRGLAHRLTGSAADADDVTAIVFFEAWRRRDRVRMVEGSPIGWLLVTTSHTASNLRRARSRHAAALSRIRHEHAPDPAAIAEERVDAAADRTLVQQAFATLSERDQELLLLCVVEELSPADVAPGLGASAGTVRTRLHRAKGRLRVAFIAAGALATAAILAVLVIPGQLAGPGSTSPPSTASAARIPVACVTEGMDSRESSADRPTDLDPASTPADAIALCVSAAGPVEPAAGGAGTPESTELQVDGQSAATSGPQGGPLSGSKDGPRVCDDGTTVTVILGNTTMSCSDLGARDITDERSLR